MAPHSSTLAWKIPWMEEPGGLQSTGSLRIGHDWTTSLSFAGEGNGNPLQCSCLENPRDGGAWWAAVCGVTQSRTRLKRLSSSSIQNYTLSCSKHKHSIMYQVPGWGQLCWGIVPSWVAACSHVCVAVCFSRHCYMLCWGSCPRARDRSACMEGSCMFLSSLGCSQELWGVTFYLGRNMKKNDMKK